MSNAWALRGIKAILRNKRVNKPRLKDRSWQLKLRQKNQYITALENKTERLELEVKNLRAASAGLLAALDVYRFCYIQLKNTVEFADNGEAAYVADESLMSKFDGANDIALREIQKMQWYQPAGNPHEYGKNLTVQDKDKIINGLKEVEALLQPIATENCLGSAAFIAGRQMGRSQLTADLFEAIANPPPEVSDRDFADLVNSLRDTATKYAGTQQLRAQIANSLKDVKFFLKPPFPALNIKFEPEDADTKRLDWMLEHMRKQLWHTVFFEYQHCKTLREAIDAAIEDAKHEDNHK